MEADSRFSWIENRLQHSLKIKIDELRFLFNNEQEIRKLKYFLNVAHCQQLFVYHSNGSQFIFSTECPENFHGKSILFCKENCVKITLENIDEELTSIDLCEEIIGYSEAIVREVFLPLTCNIQIGGSTNSQDNQNLSNNYSDKMLDLMHRLISNLQVADGFNKGEITLAQPNIEVLQDFLRVDKKRSSVLHILETTLINWCKQIKIILQRENITSKQNDPSNTPLTEIGLWKSHLENVLNVQKQLHLPITKEILANLERVNSQYYHSFVNLMIEISEEKLYSKDMLKYLEPLSIWFEKFNKSTNSNEIVSLIPALLRQIFLLWKYNKYYHVEENIFRFLKIFSKMIIDKVFCLLDDYKNKTAEENLENFKNALKVCAKFRGTYLDTRDMVDEVNRKHETENADLILAFL